MSLRCLRQRNNHVVGVGIDPPFATVRIAALRHGSSDRNANTLATRNALAKFDWVLWNAYSTTNLESNIADIRSKAARPQHHSNYTILGQTGGQLNLCNSITRSGSTVTVNTADEYGTAHAPDSNIAAGKTVSIINSPVSAYNGDWVCDSISGNSWTFTATGGALTAADDTSGQALCQAVATAAHTRFLKMGEMPTWWLWKQGTSGVRYDDIDGFGAFTTNPTTYAPADSNGKRMPQWRAEYESSWLFSQVDGLDKIYIDNFLDLRQDAGKGSATPTKLDLKQTGVQQNYTDTDVVSAWRTAHATYADELRAVSVGRAKSANQTVIGNHDSALEGEYYQALDDVFLEGVVGRSWSKDTVSGFATAMSYYNSVRSRLKDPLTGIVMFVALLTSKNQGRDGGPNDYSRARYAFAFSQLLGQPANTYLCIKADDDAEGAFIYDEFNAKLGNPVEGDQTSPRFGTNGYGRKFENGMVILNASRSQSLTVDLTGQGYKRLDATQYGNQNATVNNGQAVTTLTINPWDAIVLIKS